MQILSRRQAQEKRLHEGNPSLERDSQLRYVFFPLSEAFEELSCSLQAALLSVPGSASCLPGRAGLASRLEFSWSGIVSGSCHPHGSSEK